MDKDLCDECGKDIPSEGFRFCCECLNHTHLSNSLQAQAILQQRPTTNVQHF